MAHEISIRANGFAEIAFVGETPWHGLGQALQVGATQEEWRKAAGFDWEIKKAQAQFQPGNFLADVPRSQVLYRSDNQKPLSIVSDRYQIVQPEQVLGFFENFSSVSGFRLHTAGVLNGGRRLWALAETGKLGEVTGNDQVAAYLLLATSCDRGLATTARFTTVRVVCANTLALAESKDGQIASISHSTKFNAEHLQSEMGLQLAGFEGFMDNARDLSRKQITEAKFKDFLGSLISKTQDLGDRPVEENRAYRKILQLFSGEGIGSEMVGSSGTYWGALNAVTEYVDHRRPARSADSRLNHAWFSGGNQLKTTAYEMALAA